MQQGKEEKTQFLAKRGRDMRISLRKLNFYQVWTIMKGANLLMDLKA